MKLIIHKQTLVVGLSWDQLPPEGFKAEASRIARDRGTPFGVIRAVPGASPAEYQLGRAPDAASKGLPSAAAVLASQYESIISGSVTDDGKIWLCAINKHTVLSGGDAVLSEEQFAEAFKDFHSTFSEEGIEFDVFLDSEASALVGEALIQASSLLDAHDIDDVFDSAYLDEIKGHALIKRVVLDKKPLVVGGAVVALAAILYLMFGGSPSPQPAAALDWGKDTAKKKADKSAMEAKRASEIEALIAKAKAEALSFLNDEFNATDEVSVVNGLVYLWTSFPTDVQGGWTGTSIEWGLGTPTNAAISWTPMPGSTTLMFRETMQGTTVAFDPAGKKAVSRHAVDVIQTDFEALSFIENNPSDSHVFAHYLESMGQHVKFSAPKPLALKTILPLGAKGYEGGPLIKLSVMPFSVSGTGADALAAFGGAMEILPTGAIQSIEIKPKNQSWQVNGVIYEK